MFDSSEVCHALSSGLLSFFLQGSHNGAYHFLTTSKEPIDRGLVDNVWHKQVMLKVFVFAWRLLRNRLPTKDNLVRRGVLHEGDNTYVFGETTDHLFLGCGVFGALWPLVWMWLGISTYYCLTWSLYSVWSVCWVTAIISFFF